MLAKFPGFTVSLLWNLFLCNKLCVNHQGTKGIRSPLQLQVTFFKIKFFIKLFNHKSKFRDNALQILMALEIQKSALDKRNKMD